MSRVVKKISNFYNFWQFFKIKSVAMTDYVSSVVTKLLFLWCDVSLNLNMLADTFIEEYFFEYLKLSGAKALRMWHYFFSKLPYSNLGLESDSEEKNLFKKEDMSSIDVTFLDPICEKILNKSLWLKKTPFHNLSMTFSTRTHRMQSKWQPINQTCSKIN